MQAHLDVEDVSVAFDCLLSICKLEDLEADGQFD